MIIPRRLGDPGGRPCRGVPGLVELLNFCEQAAARIWFGLLTTTALR